MHLLRAIVSVLRWLLGRAVYFLAILAVTIPVLFLRAGFVPRPDGLPGFDEGRYWQALRLYLSHLAGGAFGYLSKLTPRGVVGGLLAGLLVSRFAPRWLRSPTGALNLVALSFPDVWPPAG